MITGKIRGRDLDKKVPRFMALRALGRSIVMTARPLGKTFPFTNSPAAPPDMVTKYRGEFTTLIKGFKRIKLEGCMDFDLGRKL
jgi:hypothetical protein